MTHIPGNRKKLVVFLSRFPYPLEKGDKLRAFHQLVHLSGEFDIYLITVSDREVSPEERQALAPYCSEIHIFRLHRAGIAMRLLARLFSKRPFQTGYFYSPQIRKKTDRLIRAIGPDHIYCQLIRVSEYVKNHHQCPKTLDYMDALSKGMERRIAKAPFYSRWLFRQETQRLRQYERQVFDYFEHHTIISAQDRNYIMHPDRANIRCIPNGVDQRFFERPAVSQTHDLVFVGNMSYAPNVEAVHFLSDEILSQRPDWKLLISGASPAPSVVRIAQHHKKTELTGWVDDIRTSYLRGKVFVAPMLIGTGQQNKLLEAMALGVPCVTTSLANNAIGAENGRSILVADSADDFIRCIEQLLNDTDLYGQISEGGSRHIRAHYRWEDTTALLAGILAG